jgi:hypothetical protein
MYCLGENNACHSCKEVIEVRPEKVCVARREPKKAPVTRKRSSALIVESSDDE